MIKGYTSIILGIIFFLFFVIFSYLVSQELFIQLDFDLTVKLQDKLPRTLDLPFSMLSVLGSAETTGIIWLILLSFYIFKKKYLALVGLTLFLIGTIIELLSKIFLHHPGPPFLFYRGVINIDFPSHYVDTAYAYPSGHVFRSSFFIILFLYMLLKIKMNKIFRFIYIILLLIILFAMLISRIYLGEHWFTDVVGGLLLGLSFGIFCGFFAGRKIKAG